jgi:hypothetical protein
VASNDGAGSLAATSLVGLVESLLGAVDPHEPAAIAVKTSKNKRGQRPTGRYRPGAPVRRRFTGRS